MATATVVTDRKAIMRDKRAQGIAAMGLVNREGDRFRVTTPSLRGRRASYEVWRDEAGKVRCSCLEFEEQSALDPAFRCEHIMAVKHSLLTKNSEAVTKQAPATPAASPVTPSTTAPASINDESPAAKVMAVSAADHATDTVAETATAEETPTTNANHASERRDDDRAGQQPAPRAATAGKVATRFVRELPAPAKVEESTELDSHPTTVGALAQHTHEEEHHEMNQRQATINVEQTELDSDFITAEEHEAMTAAVARQGAPVVPLAFNNTLRTLRQPIDPKFVKMREGWVDRQGNKHMVEYVEWHTVADLLDRVTPTWSHSVRNIVQIGDMVAVTAAITIDGVTREGVGTGTADNETGIKKAEHDALKRAAIKFGIARELYQRESEVIETQGAGPQVDEFPRDPLAKSMADLVTPKQLGMIRALAREAGVDVEEECQTVLRCRTEELSKRAASSFIDHLKRQPQEAAAGGMRRAS
ncbi:MAG: hypothetical protein H0W76_13580 [Pyrinomonadaceae bacterium]|nr:hypothetical protein [Pyrinomonadaceae bacterium]